MSNFAWLSRVAIAAMIALVAVYWIGTWFEDRENERNADAASGLAIAVHEARDREADKEQSR